MKKKGRTFFYNVQKIYVIFSYNILSNIKIFNQIYPHKFRKNRKINLLPALTTNFTEDHPPPKIFGVSTSACDFCKITTTIEDCRHFFR